MQVQPTDTTAQRFGFRVRSLRQGSHYVAPSWPGTHSVGQADLWTHRDLLASGSWGMELGMCVPPRHKPGHHTKHHSLTAFCPAAWSFYPRSSCWSTTWWNYEQNMQKNPRDKQVYNLCWATLRAVLSTLATLRKRKKEVWGDPEWSHHSFKHLNEFLISIKEWGKGREVFPIRQSWSRCGPGGS